MRPTVSIAIVIIVFVVVSCSSGASSTDVEQADEPGSSGDVLAPEVEAWCSLEPLVSEPRSDRPADVRLYHTAQLAWALTVLEVAPIEIRSDIRALASEIRRIHDELEAASWDPSGVERSLSPEALSAQEAIEDRRRAVCP